MEGDWPLVGREHEVAEARRLLASGAGGLLLAGPAGVGKTRLAVECLALATAAGFEPLRVAATVAAGTLPLGAFAPLLPELVGGADRAEVLRQIAESIARRGGDRGVALLVDDIHLLDQTSTALVHQLGFDPRVLVIATVRSEEPTSDAVVALWKEGAVERFDLAPLTIDEVERLLTDVLGGRVDGGALHRLHDRSGGNLLFLRELVTAALAAGALRDDGGLWRLTSQLEPSSRLVEVIESRLAGLSEAERDSLELVALGEPLDLDVLQRLGRGDLGVLEDLRLVAFEPNGSALEARLAHPLYGEVLRARMSPRRVRAVSRLLGETSARTDAARPEDALRVAVWQLDGGGPLDPEVMLTAARHAYGRDDLALAERLAVAARGAGGGFAAGLLVGTVLAQQARADEAEAELVALVGEATTDAERSLVASARFTNLFARDRMDEAMALLDEAEATIADPQARADLVVLRLPVLLARGDVGQGGALAMSLLDETSGQAFVVACLAAGLWLGPAGRLRACLDAAERGRRAQLELTDAPVTMFGPDVHVLVQCEALSFAGHPREAEELATATYQRAVVEQATQHQGFMGWALSRSLLHQGRMELAAHWARLSAAIFRERGELPFVACMHAQAALALAQSGRTADADAAIAEYDAIPGAGGYGYRSDIQRARAWTSAARGDLRAAAARLRAAAAADRAEGCRALEGAALHDLARLGYAAEVVEPLAEVAAVVEGPLGPARAVYAAALADGDPARLEAVAADFGAMAAVLFAAEAAAQAAVLWRRDGAARAAAAADRRARALAGSCGPVRTPALEPVAVGAVLSPRELEVARFAASGASNRAIADRLCLSVRTVENKLHSVYAKLGVAGRAELAGALERD